MNGAAIDRRRFLQYLATSLAAAGRVQRHTYDPLSGQTKAFVSGYSNT